VTDPSATGPIADPGLLDSEVEAPVSRLADFHILRRLGSHDGISSSLAERRGDFGFVKRVTLKVADESFQEGLDIALRLSDEARLGMRLSHPNLLQTLDLGRDDGRFFLVREWVDGIGLRALMHRTWQAGRALPTAAVLRVGIHVCRVLGYLHGLRQPPWAPGGIVHRGVAPSNVLLSWSGELRLANLFMARAAGRAETAGARRAATHVIPSYAAPETGVGATAGPAADIYSLGVVLYECLGGADSLGGEPGSDWTRIRDDASLQERLEALDVSENLREVLVRATAARPEHRYRAAGAMRDELRRILEEEHRSDGEDELRGAIAAVASR